MLRQLYRTLVAKVKGLLPKGDPTTVRRRNEDADLGRAISSAVSPLFGQPAVARKGPKTGHSRSKDRRRQHEKAARAADKRLQQTRLARGQNPRTGAAA